MARHWIFAAMLGGLTWVSTPASATVIFDTIHATSAPGATRFILPGSHQTTNPASGPLARGGPIALSFFTPTSIDITQIALQLNANTPSDGGTVLVSIVKDDGSGGPGAPGQPTHTGSGSNLVLTNATLFGSILDSALTTATAANLSSTMIVSGSIDLTPGEYWLALENTSGPVTGTAKWIFDTTAYFGGIGTTGQSIFSQAGANGTPCAGVPCTFPDSTGLELYEARITGRIPTPEPASLGILGIALAGLGLAVRRRRD